MVKKRGKNISHAKVTITNKIHFDESVSFQLEDGAWPSANEWNMIIWILEHVGGKVIARKVNYAHKVKTSDLFHNKACAEIKHTAGTLDTLDKRVREAAIQAHGEKAFIGITGANYTNDAAIITVANRMWRSGLGEAYLIRKDKLVAYLYI